MWILKSSSGRVFYIRADKNELFVGRSHEICDLALAGDSSISRRHVALRQESGQLELQDLASKYGTFLNDNIEKKSPIGANKSIKLNDGDRIRFGVLENIWTVKYLPFKTCTSTMKGENLEELKKHLKIIGASHQNEWDDTCTHLTMPAITLTVKVLAALAYRCYIVTPDYWKMWCKVVIDAGTPPDPSKYLPEVIESTLNKDILSFEPDERRTKIFTDKKFIFFSSKQMKFYKMVIEQCGGTVALMRECKMTKSKLCSDNIIVVQISSVMAGQESQSQQTIIDIQNYMSGKSLRLIPDVEIGLAILLVSIDKYCNPTKNFAKLFNPTKMPMEKANAKILAPETQDVDTSKSDKTDIVIDESLVSVSNYVVHGSQEPGPSRQSCERNKRKLPESDDILLTEMPPKKALVIESSSKTDNSDDDMFAFVDGPVTMTTAPPSNKSPAKKLTFLKTKHCNNINSDEGIFDFVPDQKTTDATNTSSSNQSRLLSLGGNKRKQTPESEKPEPKRPHLEKFSATMFNDVKTDISELLKKSFWKSRYDTPKQEFVKNEIEEVNNTSLGSTIVTLRSDLIVKSNTLLSHRNNSHSGANFKKFRKVLPLYLQKRSILA